MEIEITKLDPNPFQPRLDFSEEQLGDLARSIKQNGVLEPIIVRPKGDRYEICVGERRVRACKLAGISQIQAIAKQLSDKEMALYVLVENLQRQNLNPIEKARALKTLQEQSDWSQERMAREVGQGLTRDQVAQTLRLLAFSPELQEAVSHDTITPTHAEALARLADERSVLNEAIRKVVEEKLTTRETEQYVEQLLEKGSLRKQILEYVTSEEHILEHLYLRTIVSLNLKPEDTGCCVLCDGPLVYDESKGQRFVCQQCGWEYSFTDGLAWELLGRIRQLRQK